MAPGLRVGHVHLHVGSVADGLAFYRDLIGFDVWALIPSAAFVSAGGYHHHLGFNTWLGEGVPPTPPGPSACAIGRSSSTTPTRSRPFAAVSTPRRARPSTTSRRRFVTADPWDIGLRVTERDG